MATQDRYDTPLDLRTTVSGKIVYRSVLPRFVSTDPLTDNTITANDALRMDVIAQNVYGDATQWWRIAAANGRVNGSLFFRPGTTIIIPAKQ